LDVNPFRVTRLVVRGSVMRTVRGLGAEEIDRDVIDALDRAGRGADLHRAVDVDAGRIDRRRGIAYDELRARLDGDAIERVGAGKLRSRKDCVGTSRRAHRSLAARVDALGERREVRRRTRGRWRRRTLGSGTHREDEARNYDA